MKKSLEDKIQQLYERFQEVGALLSDPDIIGDQNKFKELSKEYAHLEPLSETYSDFLKTQQDLEAVLEMEADPDMATLAAEEKPVLEKRIEDLESALILHLLPKDKGDDGNVYLEIRAGTGGDEAAIFAGDIFRMYTRYAEAQGWHVEIIHAHHAEQGGYKEIVARVSGHGVYAQWKFESGVHRVQRVPVTESQGRVHTSAITVAVLPEREDVEDIIIRPEDLRVDTYRSSGAGGQHVNKTDSAIRLTHLPTGLVVECQDERSQHKNRARAMALLKARLLNMEETKQREAEAQTRKLLVGTGDRSERIRTYNFPQGRVTDHRINITLYQLPDIMNGNLKELIDALSREHQAELLAELGRT